MYIIRFITLFYKIKLLFPYLPKDIQSEAVDVMEEIYTISRLAKIKKMKGEQF